MLLSIRSEDIVNAAEHAHISAAGRHHTSHHPLALALKRVYGDTATILVTRRWLHLYDGKNGICRSIPMTGSVRTFDKAWRNKRESPCSIVVPGL